MLRLILSRLLYLRYRRYLDDSDSSELENMLIRESIHLNVTRGKIRGMLKLNLQMGDHLSEPKLAFG